MLSTIIDVIGMNTRVLPEPRRRSPGSLPNQLTAQGAYCRAAADDILHV
jgi:hypothetical protein